MILSYPNAILEAKKRPGELELPGRGKPRVSEVYMNDDITLPVGNDKWHPDALWRNPKARFWKKVDRTAGPDACWIWLGGPKDQSRHGRFQASRMGERPRRMIQAHHWPWEQENGPVPSGMVLRHICDNPRCVNPGHLLLGTQGENVSDMWERGRNADPRKLSSPGESHPSAKVTEAEVKAIRARRGAGESFRTIAVDYPLAESQLRRIATGESWTHV